MKTGLYIYVTFTMRCAERRSISSGNASCQTPKHDN